MSKFIKYDSTITSVTSAAENFETRSLSGKPVFTAAPVSSLTNGFSASLTFYGYNFDTIETVMLSSANNDLLFSPSDAVGSLSAFNYFNSLTAVSSNSTPYSAVSANYPEISGYPITSYTLNNYNSMTLTFPTASATGEVNIIAINKAGYGVYNIDTASTITIRN